MWRFLKKKLNIELPHDPAFPLLGIYLEKPQFKKTHICLYLSLMQDSCHEENSSFQYALGFDVGDRKGQC